jgi:hypothetical protein
MRSGGSKLSRATRTLLLILVTKNPDVMIGKSENCRAVSFGLCERLDMDLPTSVCLQNRIIKKPSHHHIAPAKNHILTIKFAPQFASPNPTKPPQFQRKRLKAQRSTTTHHKPQTSISSTANWPNHSY